jgi:predicted metal-binding membrane protein
MEHEVARFERAGIARDALPGAIALAAVAAAAWAVLVAAPDDAMGMPAFLAAWLVMMAAMMLPSAAPLVLVYRRGAAAPASAALTVGYLSVWVAVGTAAYGLDGAIEGSGAAVTALAIAGTYELTPLKRRLLGVCRDPAGFLVSRWRGGAVGAFRLGAEHGLYCLGCCWALMAVLVVAAAMGLAWAAVIAAAVFAEKVLPAERFWRLATAGALFLLAIVSVMD